MPEMKRERIEAVGPDKTQCKDCGVRDLVLFADLSETDFSLIHLPINTLSIAPGESLYSAGADGDALFTVRSGLLKLVQYLPDGMQRTVRLLRHGDTAGLEVTLGQPYEHAAIALRPTSLCRIPRGVVERLFERTPRLQRQLMRRWHGALRQADGWLTELSTGRAPQRLARLLLDLMEPDGRMTLLSREDMGAILGITPEHASRTVAELRKAGAIGDISGNNCHGDRDRLAGIAAAEL